MLTWSPRNLLLISSQREFFSTCIRNIKSAINHQRVELIEFKEEKK